MRLVPKRIALEIEVPRPRPDRPRLKLDGEGFGVGSIFDHLPVYDGGLVYEPCPFEIADGDPPEEPALNRIDEIRVSQRLQIAGALHARLLHVHRTGNVDSQQQLHVHVGGHGCRLYRAPAQSQDQCYRA